MDASDELIIREVLEGNHDAFRQLIERYQTPIFRFLANLVDRQVDVEDIAQETFWAAFRSLQRYDSEKAAFPTWLFTIARNKAYSNLRGRQKQPASLEEIHHPSGGETPAEALENKELMQRFDTALQDLPFEQRSAFVLVEFDLLTYEQACQVEEVPLGTLKSRVNRARQKLLQQLDNCLATKPVEENRRGS